MISLNSSDFSGFQRMCSDLSVWFTPRGYRENSWHLATRMRDIRKTKKIRETCSNLERMEERGEKRDHKNKPTCGGGSIKWNSKRSSTFNDFNVNTTFAKLVRWISGTVPTNISLRYCVSVYKRNAEPGPVRPARPDRWLALAWLIGYTLSESKKVFEFMFL